MVTTALNAALGLGFWIAAARLYPADVVGLGAGAISAMQLVALTGWVGMQYVLLRYMPVAGGGRRRLLAMAYACSAGVALVVGTVFVLALADRFDVGFITRDLGSSLGFLGAVCAWVVFSLQDAALVGLRRAVLVPLENALYGAVKLGMLVALASTDSPWSLFVAWTVPAAVLALGINFVLFRRLLTADESRGDSPSKPALARFAVGQHAVAVMAALPDYLVPLLIIGLLSDKDNAYYYAAWTIGFSARLLAVNMANALTVEGAYDRQAIRRLTRTVSKLSAAVLVPVVVVMLVATEQILSLFGARYGGEAAGVLRYFALSLIPFTLVSFVVAIERVRERVRGALVIISAGTITTLALDVGLLAEGGIEIAGIAWLAGQVVSAIVALAVLWRDTPDGDRGPAAVAPASPVSPAAGRGTEVG
jgi:O-antigen/teichoic acid export membrane protein